MDVILLDDVEKVGLKGDVVTVARGYARNYLLPRKLAEPATPGRLAELSRLEQLRARHEAQTAEQAQDVVAALEQPELRLEVKAGPTGSLFGSVTATHVAEELWRSRRIRVDRRKIDLPDPIKHIGRYSVPVQVYADVSAVVQVLVVPEGGELPPEEEHSPTTGEEMPAGATAQDGQETQTAETVAEGEIPAAGVPEAPPAPEPETAAE